MCYSASPTALEFEITLWSLQSAVFFQLYWPKHSLCVLHLNVIIPWALTVISTYTLCYFQLILHYTSLHSDYNTASNSVTCWLTTSPLPLYYNLAHISCRACFSFTFLSYHLSYSMWTLNSSYCVQPSLSMSLSSAVRINTYSCNEWVNDGG